MRTAWLVLFLSLALLPLRAAAQDNAAFAQQRYQRGVELYDARDFERALTEFRASLQLYASPNTRLYEARSLRALGRLPEAIAVYERAAREASDRAQLDPRYAATRDAAQNELGAVLPGVGRLTLAVPDIPANARVTVGGREIPVAGLGVPMPVMPGRVEVVVEAEGYETARGTAEVAAAGEAQLTVRLHRTPTLEGHTETPWPTGPRPVVPPPPRRSPLRTASWVGFGVGAAGFVAFGVFALMASGRYDDLNTRCGGMPCPESERDAVDGGRTLQTLTNVSLGVGLVGAAAGAVLFVLGRPSPERPAPVRVGITPGSVSVGGVF